MYEYTTEVFSVGLQGLAAVDTDKLGAMAAEGWEPSLMTPVHNGFATLVLFRRESDGTAKPGRLVAAAPKARPATAAAAPSKKAAAGRGAGVPKATATSGRVRRSRPS
ncbi:MAG: hypothetical protein ACR2MO_05250 [Acidimicrobiales bacterium]